jgi:molybdopterin-biosynthesis enzyme MoeA-like protein
VISGGLGATPDDVTVEAIAETIGEGVELDQRVLKWIEEKLGHLVNLGIVKKGMTPDIEKIAMIPKGMIPIYNRIGLAPGLVGKVGKSTLIILPGVPAELKNLFEEISEKYVKAEEVIRSEELKVVALESDLIPYFKRILEENPDVKVGSYPIVTEKERFLLVKFYLRGKDPEFVKGVLKKVKDNFINSLLSEGFPILEF